MRNGAMHSTVLTVIMVFAGWAAFGAVGGTAVSAILFAAAACFWVGESRWTRLIRSTAVLVGLLAVVCLFVPAVMAAREAARCAQCMSHLKQIGMGVRLYRDTYGCYPLPCTSDKAGRPMHSWRPLILPFLINEHSDYDLHQPWDSPSNKDALARYQRLYCCPSVPSSQPHSGNTNYVAVVGRRAAGWHRDANQRDRNSQQQNAGTFFIVETANSEIPWKEPKDVYVDDLSALRSLIANSPHRRNNGYFLHETPARNAALIDGDMMFMFPCDSTPFKVLLPSDRDRGTSDTYGLLDPLYREEPPRTHWPHSIGLPVWMVSLGLLVYQGMVASRRLGA